MAHTSINAPAHSALFNLFTDIVATVGQSFADYNNYRKTRNELLALSDRDLSDLGLSRSMIERVALDAVYGK